MQVLKEISAQTAESTQATSTAIAKLAELSAGLRKSAAGFRLPGSSGERAGTQRQRAPPRGHHAHHRQGAADIGPRRLVSSQERSTACLKSHPRPSTSSAARSTPRSPRRAAPSRATLEQPDNAALLERCAQDLHQVQGVLRVLEIYGAALLAEEMEHVAQYLLATHSERKSQAESLDALMRAMVQLPRYLERVLAGGRDLALVLLPLLNDLRAVRGNSLLSEGTLLLLNLKSDKQAQPIAVTGGEAAAHGRAVGAAAARALPARAHRLDPRRAHRAEPRDPGRRSPTSSSRSPRVSRCSSCGG